MRRALGRAALAAAAIALAACSVGGPATPTPKGSVTPKASAAPKARVAKLVKPGAGTTTLRGRVTLDAAYALTRGGSLLAAAAGAERAVAVAGARLDAGGQLVSDQGGAVIAQGAGNVVAAGAGGAAEDLGDGTLLAGGGVISTGGNGVVSNNGGGVISTGGNGLVGQARVPYRLAASEAPGAPQAGTELPAAGMLVSVVSLATRGYLPLGQDPEGKPVYAVWSGVAGEFEVHVPADAATNVLVVATAPGARDRRLSLNVVVTRGAEAAAVSELDRLVSRYLRRAFTGRLVAALRNPEIARALTAVEPSLTERGRADLATFIDEIAAAARDAALPADASDARLGHAAQRLLDLALADLDLGAVRIDAADVAAWEGRPPMPVLDGYRANLADLLAGAGAKLRAQPGFFTQAYLADVVNAPVGDLESPPIGDWEGAIRTPGDLGEFLLVEFLSSLRVNHSEPIGRLADELYGALAPADGPEARAARSKEFVTVLYGAGMQTMLAFARRVATEPGLKVEARKILAEP